MKRKKGYKIRAYLQLEKWMKGISEHNYVDDECCPDFTCCANILPDDYRAKKIVYDIFLEDNLEIIREYKIKLLLK